MAETVAQYLKCQIERAPRAGITFEELRKDAPGTYEDLKEAVFDLLRQGKLKQRFTKASKTMTLVERT